MRQYSMKSSPLVSLLFGAGLPTIGYQFERLPAGSRNSMVREILAEHGAVVTEGPSLTLVEVENKNALYLITQAGHFAHPSILKRALTKQAHGRCVEVSGFTASDPDIMAVWMAQFEEQDARMRNAGMR